MKEEREGCMAQAEGAELSTVKEDIMKVIAGSSDKEIII